VAEEARLALRAAGDESLNIPDVGLRPAREIER